MLLVLTIWFGARKAVKWIKGKGTRDSRIDQLSSNCWGAESHHVDISWPAAAAHFSLLHQWGKGNFHCFHCWFHSSRPWRLTLNERSNQLKGKSNQAKPNRIKSNRIEINRMKSNAPDESKSNYYSSFAVKPPSFKLPFSNTTKLPLWISPINWQLT